MRQMEMFLPAVAWGISPTATQADEALAASTGSAFAADPEQHAWRFGMEPITGLTLYVRSLCMHHAPSDQLPADASWAAL